MFDLGQAVGYLLLDTSGFKKGFTEAEKQMKSFLDKNASFNDKIQAGGKILSSTGGMLTKYVTAPLIGAGTALLAFASSSETAFSQFQAKVGDLTGEMENYRDVMEQIYKDNYGENLNDVADAMGEVVNRFGELGEEELTNITESALALRDTFEYDINESLRAADSLMKNFGLTSDEAFDFIVKGTQEGLDYSGEFLDTINEYSVQFQKLGFDAEDMFAILKEGADSGAWNLDKIGDAIKEFSIRAIDGSNTTKEGFEALGLNADIMGQKFAAGGESAKQAFADVIESLKNMNDPVQQSIAGVNLFGTMWEDLGPDVILQLSEISDEAINMAGSMDKLKEVRYDNLGSALEGLGRSIKVAGASLGEYLIPKVEAVIDFVDGLVESFDSLSDGTKNIIVNVGLVTAALGPIMLIVGKIVTFVPKISTLIAGLTAPLGTVLGIIAAVAAGVVALYAAWQTNFAGIRDATTSVLSSIQTIIQSVMSIISSIWESDLMGIRTIAEDTWDLITSIFETAFNIIQDIFKIFADIFSGDWESLWTDIVNLFADIWDGMVSFFENFLTLLIDIVQGWIGNIVAAFEEAWNFVWDAIKSVWDSITSWFEDVLNDPIEAITSLGSKMFEAGKELFNNLWDGIKSIWESIVNWVQDKVDWLISKIKFWEDESSSMTVPESNQNARISGYYASGLDYVPSDRDVRVHEGERILTKEENKQYSNNSSKPVEETINLTIELDGDVLARKQYKRNKNQQNLHGIEMIG